MTDKIKVVICDYCECGHIIRGECTNPLCPKSHESCTWTQDKQHYRYETGCNRTHYFFSGTLGSNVFLWCPYCGKPIKDIPYSG
jgi:hypothetical protein